MRTCLSDLSKSGIDPEKLKVAQQLSGMFPREEQVYMVREGNSFYLLSEYGYKDILDKSFSSPKFKRDIITHTSQLRSFRIDDGDFSNWFEKIAG